MPKIEIKFSDLQKKVGSHASNKLSDYYKGKNLISSKNPSESIPTCGRISLGNFQTFKKDEKIFSETEGYFWKWGIGIWGYDIYSFGHPSNNHWFNVNQISQNFLSDLIGFNPQTISIQATGREVQFKIKTQKESHITDIINFNLNEGPGVNTFTENSPTFTFDLNENGDLWVFSKLTCPSTSNKPVGGCLKLITAC